MRPGNRELPIIAGELPVLPKHWWEGTDAQGKKRDITATTLEIPLGSGPYRIKEFVAGRSVVLERVKDYWGKDLPVNIGQNNFDEIALGVSFATICRRAKPSRRISVDWLPERSAKQWATAYDFPAVTRKARHQGTVSRLAASGGCRALPSICAARCSRIVRLRRAFNYAFDWRNRTGVLSTGEYHRDNSYFDGIPDFMATGLPEGQELEILEPLRDKVPAEVFTTPYKNPVNGNAENVRNNLREASRLLKEAGFETRIANWSIQRASPSA